MQVKQITACKTKPGGRSMKKEAMARVYYILPSEYLAAFNYLNHLTRMESAFEHQWNNNHKDLRADINEVCTESSEWKYWEMSRNKKQGHWKNNIFLRSASIYLTCWLISSHLSIWLSSFECICTAPFPCSIVISQFLMLLFFHMKLGNAITLSNTVQIPMQNWYTLSCIPGMRQLRLSVTMPNLDATS